MGASNHSKKFRQKEDFYATDPVALDILFQHLTIDKQDEVWECCAGLGHLSKALRDRGFTNVRASELYYREGTLDTEMEWDTDFLFNFNHVQNLDTHIITNPSYKNTEAFITTALDIVASGKYVCFWLPIRYLSGIARKELFTKYPIYKVIVSSRRLMCARGGNFKSGGFVPKNIMCVVPPVVVSYT